MSLERCFERLAGVCARHPGPVLAAAAVLALAGFAAAAARLELRTSNLDLVDPELPEVARFRRFAEEFGTPNQLIVVLEGAQPALLRSTAERLAPALRRIPGVLSVLERKPLDSEALEIQGIDPYFTSRDGRMLFLFVQPADPESRAETIAPLVTAVRERLRTAVPEVGGFRAGLTGLPQYAVDDRDLIRRDISRLSLVSLAAVGLLFVTGFGSPGRPLAAILALLAGVGWTAGLIAFVPGHLTLLSAFFAAIVFGLGVDFGIHVVDRVEEKMGAGGAEVLQAAFGSLARPLTTGALTTAAVLFAMIASGFRGFAELGFIAGSGILLCLASTLTVLPALLALHVRRKRGAGRERPPGERRLGRLLLRLQNPRLAALLVSAALAGLGVGAPRFDSNYLGLQPRGSETVRLERAMVSRSDYSPMFAVFVTPSEQRAAELVWRLADLPEVGAVRSYTELSAHPGLWEALPEPQRRALRGPSGSYAVYAFPSSDLWNAGPRARFLERMRGLDPQVTGMPFLAEFMVERSLRAMRVAALLGAVLLATIVAADLRRPIPALLALTPTLLTVPALYGLMRLFGLCWNPIDVMALPVIFGIAVDDGVHLVHRFLAEGGDLGRTLAGSGRSVVLTSATTLSAFGALAFTSHRGLASFAQVLVLGIAAALVLSVLVLPQLLWASRLASSGRPAVRISR